MPLPVIATSKALPAAWKSAAVRPCVTLHMLSACEISDRIIHKGVSFVLGLPEIAFTRLHLTAFRAFILTIRLLGPNDFRFFDK